MVILRPGKTQNGCSWEMVFVKIYKNIMFYNGFWLKHRKKLRFWNNLLLQCFVVMATYEQKHAALQWFVADTSQQPKF